MTGWMVLGTDTGVGKSHISCALLYGLRARGILALGMKPVATGCDVVGADNADVIALKEASARQLRDGSPVPSEWINPYRFDAPVAPHLAARRAGQSLSFACIAEAQACLMRHSEALVVEGAGGVLVPLGADGDMADLARHLNLPVILVVGMRLGCLNHAFLSAEALAARAVRWSGWVANCLEPDLAELEGQLETLKARLPGPCLGVYPYGVPPQLGYTALAWTQLLPG